MLIRRNSFVDYTIVFYNKSKWKSDRMYNGNIIDFWHIQENSTPPLLVKYSKISMAFYLCHHILVYELDSVLLSFVLTIFLSVIFTYFLNLNRIVKWLLSK